MFELQVTVKNERFIRQLINRLRSQPKLIEQVMRRVKEEYEPLIKALLAAEPPPSDGHPVWTSDAQKITVLAILKAQAKAAGRSDIRYVRTHLLSRGYHVEMTPAEGNSFGIQVTNDMPYHVYVKGKWQQRFHAKTGWERDAFRLIGVQAQMATEFVDQAVVLFKEGGE